jgi:pilus assembly protein Flp/PilA
MSRMMEVLRGLHNDESGQDLIEYALVAALVGFAAVAGMNALATKINQAFSTIGSKLSSALA